MYGDPTWGHSGALLQPSLHTLMLDQPSADMALKGELLQSHHLAVSTCCQCEWGQPQRFLPEAIQEDVAAFYQGLN